MSTVNTSGDNTVNNASKLVQIRDLHFQRGSKQIFRGIEMDIPRGQITTIMGPSGTGKTTLLKLIGGQLKPAKGTIIVDEQNVPKLSRSALYTLRKRMGMLFQSGALLTDLSVFDNVAFPVREHTDLPESLIRHLVLMRLHAVGLRGARDLYPAELSGGMARRVALARALILDPMMIMYDEPFTGQDPMRLAPRKRFEHLSRAGYSSFCEANQMVLCHSNSKLQTIETIYLVLVPLSQTPREKEHD